MTTTMTAMPGRATAAATTRLPRWVLIWFAIALPINLWDVGFVLLRPASLPGGSLAALWLPYEKYLTIDHSYGDLGNGFVWAQAIMTLVEVLIAIGALALYRGGRRPLATLLLFMVSSLTCAKTVLIFVIEIVTGWASTGHNATGDLILMYLAPNGVWVVMPALVAWVTGRALLRPGSAQTG